MRPLPFAFKRNPRGYKSMSYMKELDINRLESMDTNREWHIQCQYLLMEIAHAVNALRNGNNDETIAALYSKKIATNCAKLVDLQDASIHLLEPSISARRVQWQSFIDGK